jgi:hypothetical protein
MENGKYVYQKEWEDYRSRRRWRYLTVFSIFIFLPLGALGLKLMGLDETNFLYLEFLLAVWTTACIVIERRFRAWKCPYCKESFFIISAAYRDRAGKCLNCDMPKYYGSSFYKSK